MLGVTIILILMISKFSFSSNWTKENKCADGEGYSFGYCSLYFDRVHPKFCLEALIEGKLLIRDLDFENRRIYTMGKNSLYLYDDYIYKFKVLGGIGYLKDKKIKNKKKSNDSQPTVEVANMSIRGCERTLIDDIQIEE